MRQLLLLVMLTGICGLAVGCSQVKSSQVAMLHHEMGQFRNRLASFELYVDGVSKTLTENPGFILVKRPTEGRISSNFGNRKLKTERRTRRHNGIDIAAPIGTKVVASGTGKIVAAGWRGAYGRAVEIDHGDGLTTLYAHMNSISVRRGQVVNAGTPIGQVGNTGRSTGPHLHFEMRNKHIPMNPLEFVTWA